MTAEKWSAVLEIVSFFLVTIDLFGKTRLVELQKRVNGIADRLRNMKLSTSYWNWFLGFQKLVSESQEIGCLLRGVFMLLFAFYLKGAFREWGINGLWQIPAGVLAAFVIFFTPFLILWLLIGLLEVFLDSFLSGIIFLITKFNLQGLMLVTGAILFLISKAIILFS